MNLVLGTNLQIGENILFGIYFSISLTSLPFMIKKFSLKSVFELMISNLLFLPFYYSEIAKSSFLAQLRWMITIECANLYVMTTKKFKSTEYSLLYRFSHFC